MSPLAESLAGSTRQLMWQPAHALLKSEEPKAFQTSRTRVLKLLVLEESIAVPTLRNHILVMLNLHPPIAFTRYRNRALRLRTVVESIALPTSRSHVQKLPARDPEVVVAP
mmetsp:Transcript_126467/g.316163  ORF Transcript_126467/g.316163 Transcript_126467/m.316163 type:complete len:111 (-) Transcript_126467:1004-1336(-)